jgi:glycosyltransferase involved in cell wall biosynthesis
MSSAAEHAEVVLAMPVHNSEPFLREALETLLAQEGPPLAIVALDDCSSDASPAILAELARQDDRLVIEVSAESLGIPRAWNRVMRSALTLAPRARYAGWAGDHDRWASGWLATLSAALDGCSEASLGLAITRKIDTRGETIRDDKRRLETRGVTDPVERLRATVREMAAGNQIYGLFRRAALERVLPVPHILLYDRVVLAAAAIEGVVVQVDEPLWERRSFGRPIAEGLDRERRTFWPEGAPWWAQLPPVVQAGAVLLGRAARGSLGPSLSRRDALRAAAVYVRETRTQERRRKAKRRRNAQRQAKSDRGSASAASPR